MRAAPVIFWLMLVAFRAWGAEKLPEGPGIAARYPRDEGIAGDARVLLAEDFERGEIADLEKRWDQVSNKDR